MLFVTQIFIIVLSSSLSGVLYALGGIGKPFNTKYRDIGVSLVTCVTVGFISGWHWSLVLCFGALWGALTTYNKWVGYFFNRPDKHTVYLESWIVTGLFYGLAALPYVFFANLSWFGFAVRCLICAIFCGMWSTSIGKAWLEEGGRGFIIIATLPLLYL